MTMTGTPHGDDTTLGAAFAPPLKTRWRITPAIQASRSAVEVIDPITVATVAEAAEAMVENVDAALAAAPALLDGIGGPVPKDHPHSRTYAAASPAQLVVSSCRTRSGPDTTREPTGVGDQPDAETAALDEYAKAVLYNGLGHYTAARRAAARACERSAFPLVDGALAELVEASVRSGRRTAAAAALGRLEARAQATRSPWTAGLAACSRALLEPDEDRCEACYLEAIERLEAAGARVALARARLLYGEWLRRQGRRVDARRELTLAQGVFSDVGLGGFMDRARREVLATGEAVRKRTDATRLDLTAQESTIAQLAVGGYTNPEIGERLFISPRTVEWHLRKVFTKLGVSSRRELHAVMPVDVSSSVTWRSDQDQEAGRDSIGVVFDGGDPPAHPACTAERNGL